MRKLKHGHSSPKKSPTYETWCSMKSRIKRKNLVKNRCYKDIKICPEWLDFNNFLKDMGERPFGTTLDRINSTMGYYKENCRWATPSTQSRNAKSKGKSKLRGVYYNGQSKKKKCWRSIIYVNKTKIDLGLFYTKEEAYEAYKKEHNKYFPEVNLYA